MLSLNNAKSRGAKISETNLPKLRLAKDKAILARSAEPVIVCT